MGPPAYESSWPAAVTIDPEYKAFFQSFYRISDTPDAHETYSQQFTKDATFILASKKAVGTEQILAQRKGMWTAIAKRAHDPIKIFPFGPNSNEFMLYGTLDSTLKNGNPAFKEWSARGTLAKEDGKVKFSFYQVYLDTAA